MNIGQVNKTRKEINPGDYTYVGFYYVGPNEDFFCINNYPDAIAAFEALNVAGKPGQAGRCEHCGTNHFWGSVFEGPEGPVAIGNQCAKNFFGFDNRLDYERARALKLAEQRRQREAWAEEAYLRAVEFIDSYPGLEDMMAIDHPIIIDMEQRLYEYGKLSDRQIDFMAKLVIEVHTKEAEVVPTEPLAEGRYVIEGKVLTTKWVESIYGTTFKMLVKLPDGNKVWGTVPSKADWDKGDEVKFKGTVERSRDDQHFGFFKRPAVVK